MIRRIFGVLFIGRLVFAYLDPGSGSLLIQIIAAGLLSLTFFFGAFRDKVKSLLGIAPKSADDDLMGEDEMGAMPEDGK